MWSISERFSQEAQKILTLDRGELQRLLELCALGRHGPWSGALLEDFRALAVLHLLVLSGAQVGHLQRALLLLEGVCLRWIAGPLRSFTRIGSVMGALLVYGSCCGWSPPLLRATLVASLTLCVPALAYAPMLLAAFTLHCAIAPSQLQQSSFYLSWVSFLLLDLCRRCRQPLLRILLLSFLCQSFVCVCFPRAWEPRAFAMGLLANVALGPLFDRALMPILGFALAMALWSSVLAPWAVMNEFLAEALQTALWGVGGGILVTLRALRYIFEL